MGNDTALPRPRLLLVDEITEQQPTLVNVGFAPKVVLIAVEQISLPLVGEFAFELARALAAQMARTGAVVIAEQAAAPKARRVRSQQSSFGPLSGLGIEPFLIRERVMFFEPRRERAVANAVRGQMPQVVVAADRGEVVGATASVVVAAEGAKPEYVSLLRGELAEAAGCEVPVVTLTAARARAFRSRASALRTQAWGLAAELLWTP